MVDRDSLSAGFEGAPHVDFAGEGAPGAGLSVVIETQPGQTIEDVAAALAEVSEHFEVEPMFPTPLFEPVAPGAEPPFDLYQTGYVATLPGPAAAELGMDAFDIGYALQDLGEFVDAVPGVAAAATPVDFSTTRDAWATSGVWALEAMRIKEAWDAAGQRGRGVFIGHPDTGYTDHEEWKAGGLDKARGHNFVAGEDPDKPIDPLRGDVQHATPGHGTHTGTVMVARGGIAPGYGGTTPPGHVTGTAADAVVVPYRVTSSVVMQQPEQRLALTRALVLAQQRGCRVLSLSLGWSPFTRDEPFEKALQAVVEQNCIVLAASGSWPANQPFRIVVAPASLGLTIAVAGSTPDDQGWPRSGQGPAVDISAPADPLFMGLGCFESGYALSSGSSYSTALVAGVAALWLSHHFPDGYPPRAPSALEVFREHVRRTARVPRGWDDKKFGAGIIDAERLITTKPNLEVEDVTVAAAQATHADQIAVTIGAASTHQAATLLAGVVAGEDVAGEQAPATWIEPWARELAYLVATDADLATRLGALASSFPAESDGSPAEEAAADVRAARELIAARASETLRAALPS